MTILSESGWCAPSKTVYDPLFDLIFIEPELWSSHLLPEDIDWLIRMIAVAEIHIDETRWLDLPTVTVRRGGVRFESR